MQILYDVKDWKNNTTVVAKAKFDNEQKNTGWMFLEIETKEDIKDEDQAYAAGLLEGYLTG